MKNRNSIHSEYKFILICALIALIGLGIRAYGNWLIEKTTEEVTVKVETSTRWNTIKEAALVSSDEEGYILNFDGEEYSYTFD